MRNIWDSILRFCRSKAHEFGANIFYSNVTIRSFITTAFVKKVLKPQNYSNSMLPCFAMISLSSALHYLFSLSCYLKTAFLSATQRGDHY